MINITVNDQPVEVDDGVSLDKLAADNGVGPNGAAIALNGKVVRRAQWPETKLGEGDVVLIINAAYGG